MTSTPKNSKMPTELGAASRFALVSHDRLSVKYDCSPGNAMSVAESIGAVQANKPAPANGTVYYFEMRVKKCERHGSVSIGYSKEGYELTHHPGWRANSVGYFEDGDLYNSGGNRLRFFGPAYATNDVVGAGINYASNEFFFTKNGELVGTVRKEFDGPLFPTVAVQSLLDSNEVEVNFGKKPFAFDIKKHLPSPHQRPEEAVDHVDGEKPSRKMFWKERCELLEEKMKQMETHWLLRLQEKDREIDDLKKALKVVNYDKLYRI